MRKKQMLKRLITIVLVLLMFQIAGCKENQNVEDRTAQKEVIKEDKESAAVTKAAAEVTKEVETIKETEENSQTTSSEPITAVQENNTQWHEFASISNFLDLIDKTTNQLDDASKDIDSFAIMGDMILMLHLSVMINNAGLEQALNLSQDTYVSEIIEAPNGSGSYTSSITLDDESYFFAYDFAYNDGSSRYTKLSYVPSKKMVSAESGHTDGSITQAAYLATDDALYVSYGDSRKDISKTSQMLICQVGDNVYYASKGINEYDSEPLPVDIFGGLDTLPTDWNSFVGDFDYERMLKVEDGQIEFIEN